MKQIAAYYVKTREKLNKIITGLSNLNANVESETPTMHKLTACVELVQN